MMLKKLSSEKVAISARRDCTDPKALFVQRAVKTVLQSVESTRLGRRPVDGMSEHGSWDKDRLDRGSRIEIDGDVSIPVMVLAWLLSSSCRRFERSCCPLHHTSAPQSATELTTATTTLRISCMGPWAGHGDCY